MAKECGIRQRKVKDGKGLLGRGIMHGTKVLNSLSR